MGRNVKPTAPPSNRHLKYLPKIRQIWEAEGDNHPEKRNLPPTSSEPSLGDKLSLHLTARAQLGEHTVSSPGTGPRSVNFPA